MHIWGDKDVDWAGINDAVEFLRTYMLKRRLPVLQAKEKFGTVRVYCNFGITTFYSLFHPSYYFYQWDGWRKNLDYTVGVKILRFLNWLFIEKYHTRVYREAYRQAIAKWPHLEEEILTAADWEEYLVGLGKDKDAHDCNGD